MTFNFLLQALEILAEALFAIWCLISAGRIMAPGFEWGKSEECPVCKNSGKIKLGHWTESREKEETLSLEELREVPCPRCASRKR